MGSVPGPQCPTCGHTNPAGSLRCSACQNVLSSEDVTQTNIGWSSLASHPEQTPAETFAPGTLLSGRYEILQMLGQGGMGTVYKARDTELDRLVAIKVIRSDLANDARTLARFKQELILARQITHKNVIRIFDLGTHEGAKYITMEFVEGSDLSVLLEERRFTPQEAARTIRQICWALEAAHGESVVHRDLKPQNIMIDGSGRVCVMDFGLARSVEMSGLTRTGTLLGTPAYMSPEQVTGKPADYRSDLFSVGIIFYELLTGKVPFRGDTVWASLMARTQTPPPPPIAEDPSVPQPLSDIAMKCLAIDPEARPGSATEIVLELNNWLGDTQSGSTLVAPPTTLGLPPTAPVLRRRKSLLRAGIVAGLLAIAGGVALWRHTPPPEPSPVSVLVADFTNHTGDPVFDSTLEPMFNIALEGARFINAFNRGEARKLARKLPNPTDKLDEQSARLISVSQGINAVVTGEISRRGDQYSISTTALDGVTGNVIAKSEASAPNKDGVILGVAKLAASIRKALGDTTPRSVQLEAAGGTFQAASLEAVHLYGIGMEQQFAGHMADALQSFSKAVQLDPNFARAYAGMINPAANLGRTHEADEYTKMAMEHVDHMTQRERYRIRGVYYARIQDWPKCVEEYTELVQNFPADNLGHLNLATCLKRTGNVARAIEELHQLLQISPNSLLARSNLALFSSQAGDFQTGEREARRALQLNPAYEKSYRILAYAQVAQDRFADATETYKQLGKLGSFGASLAFTGLADIAVYQGRFSDAARILEEGLAAELKNKGLDPATDFAALANVQLLRRHQPEAIAALKRALESDKAPNLRFWTAHLYLAAGETARAQELAAGLAAEAQPESQAYAKLIAGEAALHEKNPLRGVQLFTEADKLADTWTGHFELGRAYLEAGQFADADAEFDRCMKRRGETLALFDSPNYGLLPPVYYYQGRAREGLKSAAAAESYRTYLGIRGQSHEDPLIPEIRNRLAH